MNTVSFIGADLNAALAQVHQQLGPEAIVLSVRPLPAHGWSRLWQRTRAVEVLASAPAESATVSESALGLSFRNEPAPLAASKTLLSLFDGTGRPHVFIGPPGVGKTTLLCKWLVQSVLNENRTARVWRLDGPGANTAELLTVYAELLGVPFERFWAEPADPADLLAVDLPGVQPDDADSMDSLREQLAGLPSPRIHLVLNAAYDATILARQVQAFGVFQPEDLSLCHLDEERRQGKLSDFLSGTNCCLRFLSAGQKIPGGLVSAGERCAENLPQLA